MSHWMKIRRRLLMNQGVHVDVASLVFSFTGTWTDTTMEIGGAPYRVLQLKSAGTLTMDEQMVDYSVPFDVWCVRQGDKGEKGKSTLSGSASGGRHLGCTEGGASASDALRRRTAADGANGASGGWDFAENVTASAMTYAVSVGIPASLGDILSVSGTSRSGTAWFSLPSSNNGAGGAGGEGAEEETCKYCGESWDTPARSGSNGKPGIVVIRIPIE